MRKDPIRFGIIGTGAIAPSHAYAISHSEDACLAAVCDVHLESAEKFGKARGVPFFSSVADMLAADVVDAVSVCVPSGFHLDVALPVLAAGKHVLIEKPLEITIARIDRLIQEKDKSGAKVGCIFQARFNTFFRQVKERLDSGLLGEIFYGNAYSNYYRAQDYYDSASWRGTWKVDGGGCLMNQGIHTVDLFLWLMGRAKSVVGTAKTKGRRVEVETQAHALVEFDSGASGVIEASTVAYPGDPPHLELIGSRGSISFAANGLLRMDIIDPTADEIKWRESFMVKKAHAGGTAPSGGSASVAITGEDMGHGPVFADFINALRDGGEPFVTAEEARRSVSLIESIYESSRNGRSVVVL